MTRTTLILSAVCILLTTLLFVTHQEVKQQKALNELTETKLEQSIELAKKWKATAENAAQVNIFLQATNQACLDREQEAAATAVEWQKILEQATTRDTSETEQKGVPDNATRRKLYTDLDRPL